MSRITKETIEKFIFDLQKPARYIGGELNQITKNKSFIRMAICYPDLYEIGMSNNGIRILYDIANSLEDIACERVFAVSNDFEKKIREHKIPLYTLETYTPLSELDLIGFNISNELLFTNILQVLELGKIPIYSKDRDENHPIVIAGGETASNPAPMNDFIDAFFIGDGEEGIIDILNAIRISKLESLDREQTIAHLQQIDGIYAPSKYRFVYDEGRMKIEGKKVKKRIYRRAELKDPQNPIIPNIRIAQERVVVEITRGCKNLCKFCHAGYYELPYRYNDPLMIKDRIFKIIDNVHYSDLTLSSLSISDYRHLERLLNLILPRLIEKGISISLPSLKIDKRTLPIIEQISDLRRTSLTFAVESACDEIRAKANKNLQIDDLLSIAEHVFNNGWRLLKLYFMIGLPGCEEHDEAESIIELLKKLERIGGKKRKINVTISPFVPKPHTPFQWERQMNIDYFKNTILKIKRGLPKSISIKAHDAEASILEGVLSRGDTSLGKVIYASYIDGCRLDSWSEFFDFSIWKKNLDNLIPDWDKFLQTKDEKDILPWDSISTGYENLLRINKKKNKLCLKNIPRKKEEELNTSAIQESMNTFKQKYNVTQRIRITISKNGNAKYIPHLDFIEIIKRALRITDVPVSFTQGFNKRERVSLGYPLPIGIESISELCDVDLYDDFSAKKIIDDLNNKLPRGIDVTKIKPILKEKSIMSKVSIMEYDITISDKSLYNKCTRNIKNEIDFQKETKKGAKKIKFRDAILDYRIQDDSFKQGKGLIKIWASIGNENSMRIDNAILALSEASYDDFYKFNIVKVNQHERDGDRLKEIV